MYDEVPSLGALLEFKGASAASEREVWLGWVESYVLYKLDALTVEEKTFAESCLDLDAFFRAQSEEVRYAINTCIAAEGDGLEHLLESFSEMELS